MGEDLGVSRSVNSSRHGPDKRLCLLKCCQSCVCAGARIAFSCVCVAAARDATVFVCEFENGVGRASLARAATSDSPAIGFKRVQISG